MTKEIDILSQILILIHQFSHDFKALSLLDSFLAKLFENDIWCKNSDLILIREKIEKISNNPTEANNLLFLNNSAVGLITIDAIPEKTNPNKQKISGLSSIISQLEQLSSSNSLAQTAVYQIKQELIQHKIY